MNAQACDSTWAGSAVRSLNRAGDIPGHWMVNYRFMVYMGHRVHTFGTKYKILHIVNFF